ncbi:MAG TPA: hypothetical protein VFV33_21785, partial [Gemmatimonadaceae bacterium]|nr:hypothetical protein [Gemmatimonadaceae bacterium]
ISRPKLQRLVLTLTDGPSDDAVDGWVEGQPPGQATFVPLCGSSFPAGEGARAFKSLHVSADAGSTRATVPLTDHEAFYRPTWRRVRIQLFPDGRCGLAIDGQAIVRTSEVRPLPQRARVMLLGASVGTTIAIGNVEVWEGVREDVRWP